MSLRDRGWSSAWMVIRGVSELTGGFHDRASDRRITAAAADIADQPVSDGFVRGGKVLAQQRDGRHDLPGRTVATLGSGVADERLLHRVQLLTVADPLDR